MNQRIHNLSKWQYLPEGEGLRFHNTRRRTVILEVNCPTHCSFYVVQRKEDVESNPEKVTDISAMRRPAVSPAPDEDTEDVGGSKLAREGGFTVSFLALVKGGRDRLEFAVDGEFDLLSEGSGAYVYTNDSQDTSTVVLDPVIFTRVANRRQRNPHLEMIEYQMRRNMEMMQAELRDEADRRVAALERKLETYAPQRDQRAPAARIGKAGPTASSGTEESAGVVGEKPSDETEIPDGERSSPKGKKAPSAAK